MSIPIQLFLEIIVLLGGLAGIYIATDRRITILETRQNASEEAMKSQGQQLDRIEEDIQRILINLENKANRS